MKAQIRDRGDKEDKGDKEEITNYSLLLTFDSCPMPNAQCPIPLEPVKDNLLIFPMRKF
jgi:hypothetical protein